MEIMTSAPSALSAAPVTPKPFIYMLTILRVIDGDTLEGWIDLGFNTKVKSLMRLYDIDTPEVYGPNREIAGKYATNFTELWLRGAEAHALPVSTTTVHPPVSLADLPPYLPNFICDSRKYDAKDVFGRILAVVYRPNDPISLDLALWNYGYAKTRPGMAPHLVAPPSVNSQPAK